jgi:hypothetical protein
VRKNAMQWHSTPQIATALVFCAQECHSRGIPSIKLSSMAFDVSQRVAFCKADIAILISVVAICLVECHAYGIL